MYFHAATNRLVLQVADPLRFRELIPRSRTLVHAQYNLAVPYTPDVTKLLRNHGIGVPSPVQLTYRWPGKYTPMAHQREMAEFYTLHKRGFNLSQMGTGKTAGTLWGADYLMAKGYVKKALILSPLSTIERVWQNDIFDVLMHRHAVLVYGTREQRLQALKTPSDFFILNHDGITIPDVHKAIRTDPDINLIIVDEVSMFRNADTKKYKALQQMLRPDMRLWLLTGTPCPNAPTDAYALAKLVNPSAVPKFFGAFRRQTMQQVSAFKWVPKVDGFDVAYRAMQPAIRFKKEDCLDLPPVTFESRQAELTKEQREAYEAMRTQMQMEAKTTPITAVNAADKINKLRQICCGAIKDPETDTYHVLPHAPRTTVLLDTIAEASAKVIVVVPFKGIIKALAEEVGKHYSVGVLNGDVSPKQRDRLVAAFKHETDPHVLLCHPKVMSHGLNLTEADLTVFYAPIYSNDEFQQVIERFNRAGQTRKMTVVRMAAHPLEWSIYKMIDGKKQTQDSILRLYDEFVG